MEVMQVFHMNGRGDNNSYAKNSSIQSDILSIITKPYTEKALRDILNGRTTVGGKMSIADLGCSSGPNALAAVSHMLEVVHSMWRQKGSPSSSEVTVFLNDLPQSDFNNVFASLPRFSSEQREEIGSCFVYGAPGSFYGRLFPSQTLHFVHSSSSLHWLSRAPPGLDSKSKPALNKGRIYMSRNSSQQVVEAYTQQFKSDFSSFLESRSMEVVPGGRMVFSLIGRRTINPVEDEDSYLMLELMARSLMSLVDEGLLEEEKVDSFNMPYYPPCSEEIKQAVESDGSFEIDRIESYEVHWDGCREIENEDESSLSTKPSRGEKIAKLQRAVIELVFEYHFGGSMMDEVFFRYGKMVEACLAEREPMLINVIVTLVRKDT